MKGTDFEHDFWGGGGIPSEVNKKQTLKKTLEFKQYSSKSWVLGSENEELTGSLMTGLPTVCVGIFLVNWRRNNDDVSTMKKYVLCLNLNL
jgi:hypothetical protein